VDNSSHIQNVDRTRINKVDTVLNSVIPKNIVVQGQDLRRVHQAIPKEEHSLASVV
jgi:hypothetical protein